MNGDMKNRQKIPKQQYQKSKLYGSSFSIKHEPPSMDEINKFGLTFSNGLIINAPTIIGAKYPDYIYARQIN
ncbi:cytoplasmic protein [Pteropox virus]|uniref:Cytoplasmic protein n=1 Tax=Pteropox virus TaxID=1873698 RepID=A0A1B1MRE4_9POXV|nr:cytoplasmic protein [Pteropox virus]ANS71100.1 cytoplasmic protein [Pteropox virus]